VEKFLEYGNLRLTHQGSGQGHEELSTAAQDSEVTGISRCRTGGHDSRSGQAPGRDFLHLDFVARHLSDGSFPYLR
jgi:hypothetical protein